MGVTLYDVAKKAGVSPKTVSRVINHESRVAEKTRIKVIDASEELGYVPNLWAQRLRRDHPRTLSMFFFGATSSYVMTVIMSLMDVGEEHGYQCSLFRLDIRNEEQVHDTIRKINQRLVDGIILTAPCGDSPEFNRNLEEKGIPFVCLSPRARCEDYSWVAATDEQGSYQATQHLIGLGHTRIANIVGHPDHQAATDRFVGYRKALLEAGLEIDQDLIRQGDWSFESGRHGAGLLLDLDHPPTAIMTGDDEMAAGVLRAASNRGITCPDQLSVVGFDDSPVASQISPALTTVRQPVVEIARVAADIVIDKIDHQTRERKGIVIPTELIVRDSTGPCRH